MPSPSGGQKCGQAVSRSAGQGRATFFLDDARSPVAYHRQVVSFAVVSGPRLRFV